MTTLNGMIRGTPEWKEVTPSKDGALEKFEATLFDHEYRALGVVTGPVRVVYGLIQTLAGSILTGLGFLWLLATSVFSEKADNRLVLLAGIHSAHGGYSLISGLANLIFCKLDKYSYDDTIIKPSTPLLGFGDYTTITDCEPVSTPDM
jgi:hypothetical protein